jgi:hypothetical protein
VSARLSRHPFAGRPSARRLPRALGAGACTLALLAAVAGCGDSGSPDQAAGQPGGPSMSGGAADAGGDDAEPALKISVDLTGATTLHGEASSLLLPFDQSGHQPADCAEYARGATDSGGQPMIQLPSVISAAPMDGHQVLFTNQLEPYHGPGRYTAEAFEGQGGGATVEIDGKAFAKDSSSVADTEVQPDGSGTVTFSDFRQDDGSTLSGTVRWTCHSR